MPTYALLRRWRLLFLSSLIIPTVAQGLTVAASANQIAPTTSSASTAAATCPKGTTYVSAGDGCAKAQAAGSVQRQNFFTGFTGQSYPTRPPWNVAGVDYAVGYSGTLKDPTVAGSLPACVSQHSASMFIANGDIQPCVIDHFDFSLHGGLCFMIQGTTGNTVAFTNDKFASGSNNCSLYNGFIYEDFGYNTNIVVKYSEFDDNYSCNCGGLFGIPSDVGEKLALLYNAYIGVTGRVMNGNASYYAAYNYMEGMGNGAEHGEVVEFGQSNPVVYDELWNNYYVESSDCCNTAIIYIVSGPPSGGTGLMTSVNTLYNVLVVRQGANQYNPVAAPIWLQTSGGGGNIIQSVTVGHNYIDANGSLISPPIYVYPPDNGPGYIGSGMCGGNRLLNTGAEITGTFGSGTSTLVCN
jgi:hypothetical protein